MAACAHPAVMVGGVAQPLYVPPAGFVPDEATAVLIAEAVLVPIYGKDDLASSRPLKAVLDSNDVWTVEGSLPKGWMGGTSLVRIDKRDGRVIGVLHGK